MTSPPRAVTVTPVAGLPEVTAVGLTGLADLVAEALQVARIELADGDVLVLSSKVVSKALDLRVPGGDRAAVVLGQSRRVVAERRTAESVTRIVEAVAGPVMAAAGVDASNTGRDDDLLLLPDDPDDCARDLLDALADRWPGRRTGSAETPEPGATPGGPSHDGSAETPESGATAGGPSHDDSAAVPRVGLVLSDTAGRPWRAGQTDFALGAAGLQVLDDLRGARDADGRALSVTVRCLADELAAAADLVKGKDRGIALAHLRGLRPDPTLPGDTALPPDTALSADTALPPDPTRGEWLLSLRDESGSTATTIRHEGARSLVRTGPADWFSQGSYEAVRAALGVQAGTPEAARIGIPAAEGDSHGERIERAVALALHGLAGVTATPTGEAVELTSPDPVALGQALGRLPAALWAERLTCRIGRAPGRTELPARAVVTVHDDPDRH